MVIFRNTSKVQIQSIHSSLDRCDIIQDLNITGIQMILVTQHCNNLSVCLSFSCLCVILYKTQILWVFKWFWSPSTVIISLFIIVMPLCNMYRTQILWVFKWVWSPSAVIISLFVFQCNASKQPEQHHYLGLLRAQAKPAHAHIHLPGEAAPVLCG